MLGFVRKREYVSNVLTLVGGTAFAQAILIIAAPILTRLFSPKDFGILSLYLAILTVLSVIACWRYELAIVLPKKDEDARALLALSLLIDLFTSLLVLIAVIIIEIFKIKAVLDLVGGFIWFLPPGVFISGAVQAFSAYSMRFKLFKELSVSKAVQSFSTVSFQAASKSVLKIGNGLILGHIAGMVFNLFWLVHSCFRRGLLLFKGLSKRRIMVNMKRHEDFPKYQNLSNFLSTISQHIPIVLLTLFYTPEIVGHFGLALKVLLAPAALIGNATREVYSQKAAEFQNAGKGLRELFMKTTIGLAIVGIVPFLVLGLFSVRIFTVAFGEEWRTAGEYVKYLVPWLFLVLVNPPATASLYLTGKQKVNLIFDILSVSFRTIAMIAAYYIVGSHESVVFSYGLASFIMTLAVIIYVYKGFGPERSSGLK